MTVIEDTLNTMNTKKEDETKSNMDKIKGIYENIKNAIFVISNYLEKATKENIYDKSYVVPVPYDDILSIILTKVSEFSKPNSALLVISRRKGAIPISPINVWHINQLEVFLKWLINQKNKLDKKLKK